MSADLRFHLTWLRISSCVFSRSGGTETELADLGPWVAPGQLLAEREYWTANGRAKTLEMGAELELTTGGLCVQPADSVVRVTPAGGEGTRRGCWAGSGGRINLIHSSIIARPLPRACCLPAAPR
jgi:hypothetical protein